jgi:hypothetical protein
MSEPAHRLYNKFGAANTPFAREIDKILDPALNGVVRYCKANNVDLRDAMGYCTLSVTNALCAASLQAAMEMRKKEKEAPKTPKS